MPYAIELENVSRSFHSRKAVDGVALRVASRTIYGLIGPNGSGKTTLIRMMLGLLRPDAGTITVFERDVETLDKSRIGYLPESVGLYADDRVMEQLLFWMRLKGVGIDRARQIASAGLERLGMGGSERKRIRELSKGQRQRVAFVASAAWQPELLVLDEPFSGLDPVAVDDLMAYMGDLRSAGVTIILSTHFLESVERLCDSVCFMKTGKAHFLDHETAPGGVGAQPRLRDAYRRLYGAAHDDPDAEGK